VSEASLRIERLRVSHPADDDNLSEASTEPLRSPGRPVAENDSEATFMPCPSVPAWGAAGQGRRSSDTAGGPIKGP